MEIQRIKDYKDITKCQREKVVLYYFDGFVRGRMYYLMR